MTGQIKRKEQIQQQALNAIVARSDLSDVIDTSSMKHLVAALAREMDEFYFRLAQLHRVWSIDTARGRDLDKRAAEIQPGVITRLPAVRATGAVVFSRATTVGVVLIPAGTIVKTADGIQFETTAAGTILNGDSASGDVPIRALVSGVSGNVALGTISKFETKPTGVDEVVNPFGTDFGDDEESDDAFRARIRAYVAALATGTPLSLEVTALGTQISTGQRVRYAHAVEDIVNRGEVTLYIDDGVGTAESVEVIAGEIVTEGLNGPPPDTAVGGEEFLTLDAKPVKVPAGLALTSDARGGLVSGIDYILDDASSRIFFTPALAAGEEITADYTAFTGLIREVQKRIDGDPADRQNYPGVRAAGVRVRVATPEVIQHVVEGAVSVREGYVAATVIAAVRAAIGAYINSLGISGDVLVSGIYAAAKSVEGVYDFTPTSPTANITTLDDQIPRITSGNILINE